MGDYAKGSLFSSSLSLSSQQSAADGSCFFLCVYVFHKYIHKWSCIFNVALGLYILAKASQADFAPGKCSKEQILVPWLCSQELQLTKLLSKDAGL